MAFKTDEKRKEYHRKYYLDNKDKWKLTPEQREEKKKYMKEYNKKYRIENRKTLLIKQKEYYHNNKPSKEERRARVLQSRYGITIDEYCQLLTVQDGCCLLCGINQDELDYPLYVDHNHETNKVRGLLCSKCNFKVGWIESNKDDLDEILNYIGD